MIDTGTTDTIESMLEECLAYYGISVSQLSCLATDGASVMTGSRAGLGVRLSAANPRMLHHHCVNHRTSLALGDALQVLGADYISKTFVSAVESLYRNLDASAVRTAAFDNIQLDCGYNRALTMIDAAPTRWHSWSRVVERLRDRLPAVLQYLRQAPTDDAIAKGIYKQMNTLRFCVVLLGLCDTLPLINKLHNLFERDALEFTEVAREVQVRCLA